MKETTKSFAAGVMLGVGVVLAGGIAFMTLVVTPRTKVLADEVVAAEVQNQELLAILNTHESRIEAHPLGLTSKPNSLSESEWIRRRIEIAFISAETSISSLSQAAQTWQRYSQSQAASGVGPQAAPQAQVNPLAAIMKADPKIAIATALISAGVKGMQAQREQKQRALLEFQRNALPARDDNYGCPAGTTAMPPTLDPNPANGEQVWCAPNPQP